MISRRHLRIKAMHCLYAFLLSDKSDVRRAEKELQTSIDKVYELYLWFLSLVPELADVSMKIIEDAKIKRLPTNEDLNPNLKFVSNKLIIQLANNGALQRECKTRKISWQNEKELVRKIFLHLKNDETFFSEYLSNPEHSYAEDKDLVGAIINDFLMEYEPLMYFFSEKSIYWGDDLEPVLSMLQKTIKSFTEASDEGHSLQSIYKEKDDENFVKNLFHQTILHSSEYEKIIEEKAENWDVERIAFMDILLLKMAIAEAVSFPSIPVKVTLNEYIELSKSYSSPKSKVFINGLLDKIFVEFKKNGKIAKSGRGLIE